MFIQIHNKTEQFYIDRTQLSFTLFLFVVISLSLLKLSYCFHMGK